MLNAHEGRDRILDFDDDTDVIQIEDGARRFSDLDLDLGRSSGDTLIRFAGTVIEDQRPGAIGAKDFIFG